MLARGTVTVLDPQGIAAEDDRNAMARITVPGRALAEVLTTFPTTTTFVRHLC
jgi:hypothetical protein